MKNTKKIKISDFYCTQCGNKGFPIIRMPGQGRESGHLKKLFCIYCNKECNMVEISNNNYKYTLDDFLIEYNNNNFTEEGVRKMAWKQCVTEAKEKEAKNE